MRFPRRSLLSLLVLLSFTFTILLLAQWRHLSSNPVRRHYDGHGRNGLLVNSAVCRIPDIDPFDSSVARLYRPVPTPLRCDQLAGPSPVRVSYDNRSLWLDDDVVTSRYGETSDTMTCRLAAIRRKGDGRTDDEFRVVPLGRILTALPLVLDDEFVQVLCRNRAGSLLYSDYFAFVVDKTRVVTPVMGGNRKRRRLGAVLLALDSVSRLNFLRHFPRTFEMLTSGSLASRTVQLTGYTKVGDNTLPNLLAVLCGMTLPEAHRVTKNNTRHGDINTFDALPLIWKEFSAAGIRTLYAEDDPRLATFNYLRRGFLRQPTDYYFRPMTLVTQNSEMRRTARHPHCFNGRMEMDCVLGWLGDYLRRFGRIDPVFALTLLSRITHDDLNQAGLADRPLSDFLLRAASSGLLDHSVLFLFSDHGMRFGPILSRHVGKMEERLPVHFVVVPPWFADEHPDRWRSLQGNAHRLSSPFDLHATLRDVLAGWNGSGDDDILSPLPRGRSLLRALPENRSCDDAGIAPHWCVCQIKRPIDVGDRHVRTAAVHVMDKIGAILNEFRNVCAPLTLIGVLDAHVSELDKRVLLHKPRWGAFETSPSDRIRDYLLTVKVSPSDAVFDATVRFWQSGGRYEITGPISRLDRYGNQSSCVTSPRLKLFCFCTNHTRSDANVAS